MNKSTSELAARRQALAIATAALGYAEIADTVDHFITSGLLQLAVDNPAFGLALSRGAYGVEWSELAEAFTDLPSSRPHFRRYSVATTSRVS